MNHRRAAIWLLCSAVSLSAGITGCFWLARLYSDIVWLSLYMGSLWIAASTYVEADKAHEEKRFDGSDYVIAIGGLVVGISVVSMFRVGWPLGLLLTIPGFFGYIFIKAGFRRIKPPLS